MARRTKRRPYSRAFNASGAGRRYLLSGIPADLWKSVKVKARRNGVSVRHQILTLLTEWSIQ